MGRLIDEDILIDSIPDLSVFEQEDFGTPDMIRLIEDAPTVQAIPKADYEARLKENNELINDLEELRTMINKFAESYETRLKADMVAMLTEIQLEIEELRLDRPLMSRYGHECYGHEDKTPTEIRQECSEIIQDKINALKAEKGEEDDK